MKMNKEMDLNKLSFKELETKIEELKKSIETTIPKKIKGTTYCIIRTYSAGVFAGLINRNFVGKEATIYDSQRIWYWSGASSLSQLANEGTKNPSACKFTQLIKEMDLKEIIEIIPCSLIAEASIKAVKIWEI